MKITITVTGDTCHDKYELNQFMRAADLYDKLSEIRSQLFYMLNSDFDDLDKIERKIENLLSNTYVEGVFE